MSRTLVPNSQPTLADILHEAIRGRLALVHTQIIGVVEAYDHTAQKATVRPVVQFRRVDDDTGEVETYTPPAIANVPVAFPSATGYAITFPLTVGDTGEIRFMERSIDEWLDQGGTGVTAQDPRRFDLSDAVFYPGTRSFANAIAASGIDVGAMVLEAGLLKLGDSTATEFVALAQTLLTDLGVVAADMAVIDGILGPGVLSYTPAGGKPNPAIAATKVKAI